MASGGDGARGETGEAAYRELVTSARVYYKNDKRIDWTEWKHLTNEAAALGLTEDDALRAAREALGNHNWSPPLPPPIKARWSASTDGSMRPPRPPNDADSVEASSVSSVEDTSVAATRLRAGLVINGTYRLDEEIGSGGMGVVWKASHTKLGTTVAIKFLRHALDEESTARFLREARTAARLESPHLARVFDCAQLETGELFIVMEYFDGVGLDVYLAKEGPLPVAEAVDYVLQACVGLAAAHRRGIVHRDIKPANLFLAEAEGGVHQVKVVDFGLSRLAQPEDGEGLTRDQILLGTPEYAPPEQFGSAMNAREPADIWALGATLYCLLAGKPPFPRDRNLSGLFQMSDLLERVTKAAPKPLTEIRKDVPADLDRVVLKCLAKRPEDRYPTVADLALDLAHFASSHAQARADEVVQILAPDRASNTAVPRVSALARAPDSVQQTLAPTRREPSSPRRMLYVLVAIVAATVVALALLYPR